MTAMQTEQEKWEILPLPRGIKHHNHVGYNIDQTTVANSVLMATCTWAGAS